MRFNGLLVRQQPIQRPIQPLVVDALGRHVQEVFQRRGAIPLLGHVQFARRLAQPPDHEDGDHFGPRYRLASTRQQSTQQFVKLERSPQCPAEPRRAKASGVLQAHGVKPNLDGLYRRVRFKQAAL